MPLRGERWLLPEGVEELLPEQAARVELLRRRLLDLFDCWGYEQVIPPLIEYLESLLTGVGHDLDLQTFKLTDQLSGRLLGVRPDMTPQVARIDAHRLRRETTTRLCYLGPVLRTVPDGPGGTRIPLQLGAELYGHAGIDSDIEVVRLMLEALALAEAGRVHLVVGHAGVACALFEAAGLDEEDRALLLDILQRKAVPDLQALLDRWGLDSKLAGRIRGLIGLAGGRAQLDWAREQLGEIEAVARALAGLDRLADALERYCPSVVADFDFAELRGYHYHTGILFSAFMEGQARPIATGGRYDGIGRVFGRDRPATGFTIDLKFLAGLSPLRPGAVEAIHAPAVDDPDLEAEVARLRREGRRVIRGLEGEHHDPAALGCSQRLVKVDGRWKLERTK
ncbi:MAG: ATP phosphoribosyltransferase regulatory subunit [Gammaproteobacteria bacterium]|nr:MAG: ATP phosphoribosyltransferase regulatory subunit [Gammaproteobacteria bacterium]